MTKEFEGRTEQEAIDTAVADLGLERHQFEVEILDEQKSGLFGLSRSVRIRVHLPDGVSNSSDESTREPHKAAPAQTPAQSVARSVAQSSSPEPESDVERAVVEFVVGMTKRMGISTDVRIMYREDGKVGLRLDSDDASILIGRKGRNLDALQLLANVISARTGEDHVKIVLDSEGYRGRREEQLVQMAQSVGDQVMSSRGSKLLEPMNPFERRLIHTTLSAIDSIGTESEGDGLYKQVRVFYRGN